MSSSSFTDLLDLAGERAGGCVLAASDDFFAEKENLIKAADPAFAPDKYTERGKWMDGWESRRRRGPGYDWAVIQLGIPGIIRGVVVDTRFFTGNYPEQVSLEAATAETNAPVEDVEDWIEVVPKSLLRGDSLNPFEVASSQRLRTCGSIFSRTAEWLACAFTGKRCRIGDAWDLRSTWRLPSLARPSSIRATGTTATRATC